jgi:hypothetical protein
MLQSWLTGVACSSVRAWCRRPTKFCGRPSWRGTERRRSWVRPGKTQGSSGSVRGVELP